MAFFGGLINVLKRLAMNPIRSEFCMDQSDKRMTPIRDAPAGCRGVVLRLRSGQL